MQLRAGLPFVNFIALAKETQLPKKVRIVSIPEWLSICTSKSTKSYLPHAHESMLAGFGLYDIHAHCHSSVLLNYVHEQTGIRLNLNTPTSKICPTNYLKMNGRQIPLYVGVGDHPCAVLGAGTSTAPTTISVNIGTGSQVAAIDFPQQESSLEFRPYFQDQRLTTITHIPAGRILSCCIEFLNQVAAFHSKQSDFNFWLVLQSLSVDEILNSSLSIDLAFFPGAWNYSTGGSIRQITETNFTVKNYLGSVLKALVLQYRDAINKIDPQAQLSEIILGGGVACKLPQLKTLLETTTHRKTQGATAIDETLLGLRTLAWMNTNPSMTLQKASVYFGRSSTIQLDSSEPFRD
jgi:sugar (pentulose or hexulose) kinase